MDKLAQINETKRAEISRIKPLQEKYRYAALERNDFRPFASALRRDDGNLALIAEVKKASPSAGVIAEDFDPVERAVAYDRAGASAISVITDKEYFQGDLSFLSKIRAAVSVPLLRKDFILDEVQIYESVIAGADAILLIVASLAQDELVHLLGVAATCQLDVLVEVHNLEEMERALRTEATIIGVNNRNLKSFTVDLHTTEILSQEVGPDQILVSESGIKTPEDCGLVKSWGADAILVGESLMRSGDVAESVRQFVTARME